MKITALLVSILAFATACSSGVDTAAIAKPTGAESAANQTVDLDTNIVFDKTDGVLKYRSPFDGETTLKLNKIVFAAENSIIKFDDEIDGIRASVAAGAAGQSDARIKAEAGMARLKELHDPVIKAKIDMVAARKELVGSKRYFNNIVLSGMVEFINRVDDEFNDEIKLLNEKGAKKAS